MDKSAGLPHPEKVRKVRKIRKNLKKSGNELKILEKNWKCPEKPEKSQEI